MNNVKDLSDQLKRIAYKKGISPVTISRQTELNVDFVVAALEGYPLTPISHFLKIADAIGCKLLVFG